ncbi:long-chain-fatty-acid--CoA ligase [Nocardioides acrostichi]|uniref:Long-chain-fatty-acid--CoA ligase n=1 Tax=Nocardioides acrostichi TaxID=2784339 RepID=A0A930Y8D0_9ACTN|nr:long-chain-fatty-acid--CoA ligase [Nocardioides acrostichi]MBF4162936.1 long-chain-fatty-acid--CoA ligase [Nocardioides acrostichi]
MTATDTETQQPHAEPRLIDTSDAPEPRFLDDRVAHWAVTTPDADAITYLERTWTYAQLDDRIRRLAGALAAWGVGRGDVVSFLDKNHPACLELSLAAGSLGAANAIINFRLAPDEIDYAINDAGSKVLVVGTELMPAIEKIRDQLEHVEHVVEVTPGGGAGDAYEQLLAEATPVGRSREVTPEDTALIMYSSGTTGRPKGVTLSHANMSAHTLAAHDGWGFEEGDKSLVAMPLFHVGGSSYIMFGLHDGIPSIMTREPDGASLAGAILGGANRTFLVPAVLAQVLQSGPDAVKLFGALKTYTYGAAPMPPPLLRAAMEAWPDTDFIQVYGLTEVCGVATQLSAEDHRTAVSSGHPERLVSAGKPLPGVEVRIVDPGTLEDLPVGEHGEIWLRTPQLFAGYLGKPEATAEVLHHGGPDHGWFRTGDGGRLDADGFVYVQDRLKDMIISGGENIYSPEVERVLAEHPAVMEVAVIGVPDDRWGESVKAVVAFHEGASATPDELIAYSREQLAHFKCPKTVEVVDALPRNPTGKVLKRTLRDTYGEG